MAFEYTEPHYLRTDEDIFRAPYCLSGVSETTIAYERAQSQYIDVGGGASNRRSWLYTIEAVDVIVFFVSESLSTVLNRTPAVSTCQYACLFLLG
jgi:hypothetical protein